MRLYSALLDLLIPPLCPSCDRPRRPGDTVLCRDCRHGLVELEALEDVRTAVAYEGTGLVLLRRFKFEGRLDALAVLVEILARRARGVGADGVAFVPRPIGRLRETGRDPAWELARALARSLGLPLREDALTRTRAPSLQRDLDPEARRANVRGSFRAASDGIERHTVLLVDDVVTTGATLAEAATTLRRAGAARVLCLAAAGTRAPTDALALGGTRAPMEGASPPVL